MVVEFTPTNQISAHHHYRCEFESRKWRGVLDTTYLIKFVSDLWQVVVFSGCSGFLRHNITEILLKVALSTIIAILFTFPLMFITNMFHIT